MAKHLGFFGKAVVAGLATAFLIVWLYPSVLTSYPTAPAPEPALASYADAVERAAPAVVSVYSLRGPSRVAKPGYTADPRHWRYGAPVTPVERNLGSGVIIDSGGYIVTNNHLIVGADSIWVRLTDGREAPAELVGVDTLTDLALLKIDAEGLPVMPLGRSDTLRAGDVVLAIGNPFDLSQTVTQGIVSATGRSRLGVSRLENFIQTDASINPGNSGGALINSRGELVGVNSAVLEPSRAEGISFAIPVNMVRGVTNQLIERGHVQRGWLGFAAGPLPPQVAARNGIVSGGIIVTRVYQNSPAAAADIRRGDIITRVNDVPILTMSDALTEIARLAPGTKAQLYGVRQRERFAVEAFIVERPPTTPLDAAASSG